jgi:HD-GYP domain-containing protein (c-di-GMP phosphodiesterase class II)
MPTASPSRSRARIAVASSEFTWTPLAALRLPTSPAVDVYASTPGAAPKLLWRGNSRLGDDRIAEMQRYRGQFAFWVQRGDYRRVADQVQADWAQIVGNRLIAPCDRFALCEMAYALELTATMTLVKSQPFVDVARRIGVDAARILLERPVSSHDLFYAIQYGDSRSSRAVHLAGYVVQLARICGEDNAEKLEEMAVGAIVHDVGARDLLIDVWSNPARWSPDERELVERHPQRSYEALRACGTLSEGQLMMAYQHHERMDGEGYPVGILRDEIHRWARLLAVADRFHALTSGRCFRRPIALPEALEQLASDAGEYLDAEITKCWIKSLTSP